MKSPHSSDCPAELEGYVDNPVALVYNKSMSTAIDTLKIYERLRNANLNNKAAKEIAEVINDVVDSSLATKGDINELKAELQAEIEKLRIEVKAEMDKLRIEVKAEVDKLRMEVKAEVEKVKSELRADIERSKVDTIKWVAAMLAAQAGVIAALVRLLSH
ncbi:MAG: DUF1640 domain-containing protein [Nitrospirae bacterium]|nr:DUF1640 domain-containing protein [Nitrospirota bacterium]